MMRHKSLLYALGTVMIICSVSTTAVAAEPAEDDGLSDTTVLDERLKQYWGNEVREVESIQLREYRKDTRHEFNLYFGLIPNDEFFSYYPVGARWNYYFAEDFGVEVSGAYLIRVNSELEDFLESNFNESLLVDVPQSLQWLAGANFLWSPLHGKMGLLTEKLAHFDVHLAFGVGAIGTTVRKLGDETSKVDISGNIGLGMRFFILDNLSVRFDYRQFFYPADGGGLSHPAELSISVGFWTDAPE